MGDSGDKKSNRKRYIKLRPKGLTFFGLDFIIIGIGALFLFPDTSMFSYMSYFAVISGVLMILDDFNKQRFGNKIKRLLSLFYYYINGK